MQEFSAVYITKINYGIHTDAIKQNLIPKELSKEMISRIYASEADILNVALFGVTAKLESLNTVMIKEGKTQKERIEKLNEIAIYQMTILTEDKRIEDMNLIVQDEDKS